MGTITQEKLKQVALSWDVWMRLKEAAAKQATTIRELAERAILKELDGKKRS